MANSGKRRAKQRVAFLVRGYRESSIIAEILCSEIDSVNLQGLMNELYNAKKFILYDYLNKVLSGFNTYIQTASGALMMVILTTMASVYKPEELRSLRDIVRKHRVVSRQNIEKLLREADSLSLDDLTTILYNEKKFGLYDYVMEASLGFYSNRAKYALKNIILIILLSVYDPKQLPDYLKEPSRKKYISDEEQEAEIPDSTLALNEDEEGALFHKFLEDLVSANPPD